VIFYNTNLNKAFLGYANFQGAVFDQATLEETDFTRV
jgi:uncharacterized protein YjbI with pentapeptide repeats